jgi:SAM-dependent methyltransferase
MDDFDTYARFYDLDYGDRDDDFVMIQEFAARCGSPILELGCGTGRVLLPLAHAGYQVTGVDVSPAMLAVARRKVAAEDLGSRITLVEQDMRKLDLGRRFNLALVAINSFMHLLTADDQLIALSHIRQHLEPGGLLLLDLFNPNLQRLLDSQGHIVLDKVMTDPQTGHRIARFSAQKVDLGRQIMDVTFIADRVDGEGDVKRTLFRFSIRYLFRRELELLLRQARFEVEAIYGSYDLDEFTGDSEKMIAIARRPD